MLLGQVRYYLKRSWAPVVTQQKGKSFKNTELELRVILILLERRG